MQGLVTKLFRNFYCHMRKHYHLYSFIANLLIAVSMAGLTLLGVLNDTFTAAMLMTWGVVFAVMFGVGKLLDQEIDDIDKVKEHKNDESCKQGQGLLHG